MLPNMTLYGNRVLWIYPSSDEVISVGSKPIWLVSLLKKGIWTQTNSHSGKIMWRHRENVMGRWQIGLIHLLSQGMPEATSRGERVMQQTLPSLASSERAWSCPTHGPWAVGMIKWEVTYATWGILRVTLTWNILINQFNISVLGGYRQAGAPSNISVGGCRQVLPVCPQLPLAQITSAWLSAGGFTPRQPGLAQTCDSGVQRLPKQGRTGGRAHIRKDWVDWQISGFLSFVCHTTSRGSPSALSLQAWPAALFLSHGHWTPALSPSPSSSFF